MNKLKNRQQGFTIIEVMIVLVIAAVILLMVFLAVPALQRNSKNTQYRSEAAQTLSAYSEESNNKGGQPLSASTSSTAGSDAATVLGLTKNNQLTTVTIDTSGGSSYPSTSPVSFNTIYIKTGSKCDFTVTPVVSTTTGATNRSVAAFYNIEGSGGTAKRTCQES